jgi:hypothetical protein
VGHLAPLVIPTEGEEKPVSEISPRDLLGNGHHQHDPLGEPPPENSVAGLEELRRRVVGGNGGTAARRAVGHPVPGHDKAKGGIREL